MPRLANPIAGVRASFFHKWCTPSVCLPCARFGLLPPILPTEFKHERLRPLLWQARRLGIRLSGRAAGVSQAPKDFSSQLVPCATMKRFEA